MKRAELLAAHKRFERQKQPEWLSKTFEEIAT
jgi:hypothetical protein